MGGETDKKNSMKFRILHHTDQKTIDDMYNNYSPVFILTTGRSGSKFITNLLNCASNIIAYHEPQPTLQYFSNYAFHHQGEADILTNMIDAARMELILEVFIKNKIYVESNQCLTFFAPVIATLFRKSKFVYLVRHPGDFVRSAIRKGWHKNDSIWESGRVKIADGDQWENMDQMERLSWLWMTTNSFIEKFKEQVNTHRIVTFQFENLIKKIKEARKLLKFVGAVDIKPEKIKEVQEKRINELFIHPNEPPGMKKVVDFPDYIEWNDEMKKKLRKYSEKLAKRYGYKL
jgi:hypothetical protein